MRIFISHSQDDEAAYSTFCLGLNGAGIAWWDQKTMAVGQSLAAQLREAISLCEASANSVPAEMDDAQLRGWKRAVRYGLLYLADLGLVDKQSDTSVTYSISQQGKDVLGSPRVLQRFQTSFEQVLHPLA